MMPWQHILCVVTFSAGVFDVVAIYKYYLPKIVVSEHTLAENDETRLNGVFDPDTSPSATAVSDIRPRPPSEQGENSITDNNLAKLNPDDRRKTSDPSDLHDDLVLDDDPSPDSHRLTLSSPPDHRSGSNSPRNNREIEEVKSPQNTKNIIVDDPAFSAGDSPKLVFLFGKNDTELNWRDKSELRQYVRSLRENTPIKIRLIGFTDSSGSSKYNYYLGLKRARNVANFLSKRGVARSRIQIESSGENSETSPPDPTNNQGMEQHRRVEVYFMEQDAIADE